MFHAFPTVSSRGITSDMIFDKTPQSHAKVHRPGGMDDDGCSFGGIIIYLIRQP